MFSLGFQPQSAWFQSLCFQPFPISPYWERICQRLLLCQGPHLRRGDWLVPFPLLLLPAFLILGPLLGRVGCKLLVRKARGMESSCTLSHLSGCTVMGCKEQRRSVMNISQWCLEEALQMLSCCLGLLQLSEHSQEMCCSPLDLPKGQITFTQKTQLLFCDVWSWGQARRTHISHWLLATWKPIKHSLAPGQGDSFCVDQRAFIFQFPSTYTPTPV